MMANPRYKVLKLTEKPPQMVLSPSASSAEQDQRQLLSTALPLDEDGQTARFNPIL